MIPNLPRPSTFIVPNIETKVYVKHNCIPYELCDNIISFGKENVKYHTEQYAGYHAKSHIATCQLPLNHVVHEMLNPIWEDISNYFNFDISMVEPYELKGYSQGDFFKTHVDTYMGLENNLDRKITLSLQLSNHDEYTDGELILPYNSRFKLSKGSIVAFPSFFIHQVTPLTPS